MTNLGKILFAAVALACSSSVAIAGYQFTIQDTTINIVSSDGLPLPDAGVGIKMSATRSYPGICVECVFPYPGICHEYEYIAGYAAQSNDAGIARFSSAHYRSGSPFIHDPKVEIRFLGFYVSECDDILPTQLSGWMPKGCEFKAEGVRAIARLPTSITCRFPLSKAAVERRLESLRQDCIAGRKHRD